MNRFLILFFLVIFGMTTGSVRAANTLSTGGLDGLVRCQSADPLGAGTFELGGAIEVSQDSGYVHTAVSRAKRYGSPRMVSGEINLAYGLFPVFDLGLDLPVHYDNPQWGKTRPYGVGDLELSAKLSGFFLKGDSMVFTTAYYLAAQFPTGDKAEGYFPRHIYYDQKNHWSSGNVLIHPMLISTIHFDRIKGGAPLQLHFNAGGVFNAPKDHDAFTVSAGLEYFPIDILTLFLEASAEERIGSVHPSTWNKDLNKNPIFITPGIKFTIPDAHLSFTFAGDIGVSDPYIGDAITTVDQDGERLVQKANMMWNALFAMNWVIPGKPKDSDGDGIPDKQDKCPAAAEDKDGFQDEDGCPDYDNDRDGLADSVDRCPNQAGPAENKGCPDKDSDNDGIVDRLDKCPDKAGIAELKGCPDVDTDNDGIVDRLDKCPNEAEDKDGFQDDDGCPDLDNDGDGIPDATDKCPNNPGPANNNGCPVTKEITAKNPLVLKGVNFETNKAILRSDSYSALDMVVQSLYEWPEVKVEIQGHTDAIGDAAYNQDLSQRRAEAVRDYLVVKGIAADRMTAVGYGLTKPVANNKTAAGRAQNRRVELVRSN
jgi:outer membrane protein OmpA-like peptidoglycan-associated protein